MGGGWTKEPKPEAFERRGHGEHLHGRGENPAALEGTCLPFPFEGLSSISAAFKRQRTEFSRSQSAPFSEKRRSCDSSTWPWQPQAFAGPLHRAPQPAREL